MSEHKRFKAFRSELNESEYKETLTGYPNRGIDTDVGAVKQDADTIQKINGVLAALGRYTYQHTAEAMIKIRTRLNLFMIDFPWTPWMWQSNPTGTFTLNATLFGRVDGVDGMSGNIRFDGKASPTAGMKEFALVVTVEPAEDGFYRVNAKLQPQIAVVPEGVEHDGDSLDEMAQTPARQRDMEHAIQRHDVKAQRGYEAKMNKTGKAAARGRKLEDKHDTAVRRLIARDTKEYESEKLYGRGGKIVKGKRKPVKEAAELDEELTPARQAIIDREKEKASKALNKGKTAKERDRGYARGSRINYLELVHKYGRKSDKEGSPYQVNKRELNKWRKAEHGMREEVEQIDELSKKTKDAYVAKRGSQLSSMLSGHTRGKQLTGKQQANAVKGIKTAMGGNKDKSKLPKLLPRLATFTFGEELVGGQKRLDVNKNKRLDAQDFAMLRAKKKPMKEYTETMGGIPLTAPDPTATRADKSGKGKRFHKGAIKSVEEAVAKGKKGKKPSPHQGAANVIGRQKSIKSTLQKHDMRW